MNISGLLTLSTLALTIASVSASASTIMPGNYIGTDNHGHDDVWSYGLSMKNRFARGDVAKNAWLSSPDFDDDTAGIIMPSQFMRRGDAHEVGVNRRSDNAHRVDRARTDLLNRSNRGFPRQYDVIEGAMPVSAVPVPAAAWLFGSGLIGLVVVARRKQS